MAETAAPQMRSGGEYRELTFSDQEYGKNAAIGAVFDACTFVRCRFDGTVWKNIRFNDCIFRQCGVLNVQWHGTRLHHTTFTRCKLAGLNFGLLNISLLFSVRFEDCKLLGCTFPHLEMAKMSFAGNDLEDCLFLEAALRRAVFVNVAFGGSRFRHCCLEGADFSGASDFVLDPRENDVREARFSVDSALELLKGFDIEIC